MTLSMLSTPCALSLLSLPLLHSLYSLSSPLLTLSLSLTHHLVAACENNEDKCDANDLEVAKISLSNGDGDGDTGELDAAAAAAAPQPPLPHNEEEQSFKKQKVSGDTRTWQSCSRAGNLSLHRLLLIWSTCRGNRALRSITCTESCAMSLVCLKD